MVGVGKYTIHGWYGFFGREEPKQKALEPHKKNERFYVPSNTGCSMGIPMMSNIISPIAKGSSLLT